MSVEEQWWKKKEMQWRNNGGRTYGKEKKG